MRIQLDTIKDTRRNEAERLSQAQQALWGYVGTETADADSDPHLTKKKLLDAMKILGIDIATTQALITKCRRVAGRLATYNASAVAIKTEEHRILNERNTARIEKLKEQIEKLENDVRTAESAMNITREHAEQAMTDAATVARELIEDHDCPSHLLPAAIDTVTQPRKVIATGDTQVIDKKRRRGEVFFVVGPDPASATTYDGDKAVGEMDLDYLGGDLRPVHAELGYEALVVEHPDEDVDADYENLGRAPHHAPNVDKVYAPDVSTSYEPSRHRTPVPNAQKRMPPPPTLQPQPVKQLDLRAFAGEQPPLMKRDRQGNMVPVIPRDEQPAPTQSKPTQPLPQPPGHNEAPAPSTPQVVATLPSPELANPGAIDPDAVVAEIMNSPDADQTATDEPIEATGLEDPITGLPTNGLDDGGLSS